MEPKANFILIGAFTIAAGMAMFFFVIWLGKFAVDQEFNYYDIIFEEAVTGLGNRGAVMFNGIQVGEVIQLNVDPTNPGRVIARVRTEAGTPVRADTKAQLGFQGFTGLAFIELEGGSPNSPMIEDVSQQPIPIIVAETSDLQSLLNSSGTLFENINDLLLRVNKVVSDENADRVSNLLENIELTTEEIALHRAAIGDTLEGLRVATDQANATLARIERVSADFEGYWDEHNAQLGEDLLAVTSDARATAAQARMLAERLDTIFSRNEAAVDQFAQDGLGQVAPTLQDFRLLVRRLESVARNFENNPSGFLLGDEQTVEFQPAGN